MVLPVYRGDRELPDFGNTLAFRELQGTEEGWLEAACLKVFLIL